jgi:integrase
VGVVVRPDSKYYQLNLERGKGLRCLRRPTRILHATGTKEQDKENRRLAEVAYHQAMADLSKRDLNLPDALASTTAPTLRAFLRDTYREWLRREHPSSAEQAIGRLDRHFVPLFGHTPLDQISKAKIEEWRKKRRKDGVSAHTIGRDLSDLRGLLSNAVDPLEVIEASPLAAMRIKAAPSREVIRYLDRKEEKRLFAALEARDDDGIAARRRFNAWRAERGKDPVTVGVYKDALTPMVIVALHTGVRPAELFRITWSVVDWHAKVLTVEWWVSKVRKTRRLPLNADALRALKRWQEQAGQTPPDRLIFPGKGGKPYTGAPTSWDELMHGTKIRDFAWKDMRHTFASKLVQRGVNLYVVKELMGHASIKTTERYAHLAPTQGRAAVNVLTRQPSTFRKRPAKGPMISA